MKLYPLGFKNPFTDAHCVPLAFTACTLHPSAERAQVLAFMARQAPNAIYGHRALLTRAGGSGATLYNVDAWARLAGLKVVETYRPEVRYQEVERNDQYGGTTFVVRRQGAPTVAQFARTHKTGRWVVLTPCHAQALVNGKVRGWSAPRSRVRGAVRLVPLTPEA